MSRILRELHKIEKSLQTASKTNPKMFERMMKIFKDLAKGMDPLNSSGESIRKKHYVGWRIENFEDIVRKFDKNNDEKIEEKETEEFVVIEGIKCRIIGKCEEKINLNYEKFVDERIGDLSKTDAIEGGKEGCIDPYGLVSKKNQDHTTKPNIKIAVVTSAWRTHDYIEQFLDSIENNTMHPLMVIVGIDACEETRQALAEIEKRKYYSFDIIYYFSQDNVGTYNIRNNMNDIAFDLHGCDAVICMDSDDMFHAEYIGCAHDLLINNLNCVIAPNIIFNFDHQTGKKKFILNYCTGVNCFSKQVWKNNGYYLPIKASADNEWIYRCMKQKIKVITSNSLIFYRRIHENQLTQIFPVVKNNEERIKANNISNSSLILKPGLKMINFKKLRKEKSIVGIATWKPRMPTIYKTLESLTDQVDEIHVFLNEYDHVPEWLPKFENVYYHHENGKNYGPAAKFKFQNIADADYYFTCDDDIIYPNDYIDKSIEFATKNPNCLYSYHGSVLNKEFFNIIKNRKLHSYQDELEISTRVHIGGSGVMFWNLNFLKIPLEIIDLDNFDDEIQVCKWLLMKNIKIICPAKNKNWITISKSATQKEEEKITTSNFYSKRNQFIIDNKLNLFDLS